MQYFSSNTRNDYPLNKPDGNIANDFSYDAWEGGALKKCTVCIFSERASMWEEYNPSTWAVLNSSELSTLNTTLITDRGYTLHEHLNQFALINMNGRAYDPRLGQFLSPDPFVQAPENTQSYNRYAYCLNNPMKYTDPSGYEWYYHPTSHEWKYNEGKSDVLTEKGWLYKGMHIMLKDEWGTIWNFNDDGRQYYLSKGNKSWVDYEYVPHMKLVELKEFAIIEKKEAKANMFNTDARDYWESNGNQGGEDISMMSNEASTTIGTISSIISTSACMTAAQETIETISKGFSIGGKAVGALGAVPTVYNLGVKAYDNNLTPADGLDAAVVGTLTTVGFIVSAPVSLTAVLVIGVGYGIYRYGWGEANDKSFNSLFGY